MKKKKHKGASVQELLGIRSFTDYGLSTRDGELIFFFVNPINTSVLPTASIEAKINNLILLLSAQPELEIVCTDSRECFDDNKAFLLDRLSVETNPRVRSMLEADTAFLAKAQEEMSAARQFLFILRCKGIKKEQVFTLANTVENAISRQSFEVHRMKKDEIKRLLAIYFEASKSGENLPDVDGEQFLQEEGQHET